jgi:hypothetical protein
VKNLSPDGNPNSGLVAIDVHEMWWKDLGERANPWTIMKFWLWAATFAGTAGRFHPDTDVSVSPGHIWSEIHQLRALQRLLYFFWDRILLFVKITYFFVLLFPFRILVQIINFLPGIRPVNLFRTIFSYMSSVQLYQQRRGRTGGTLVDFDQSLRISIQRRFANLLVTVAERNYDRWYVMGHSLGSVISLKGLMYPDEAFARFMSYNRWHHPRLAYRSTIPASCSYPDKPYKPTWLSSVSALDAGQIMHLAGAETKNRTFMQ